MVLSVVSIHYEHAKFVQAQKVENFQLSFTALFSIKSLEWNLILITYLFAGARSKMVSGNHALEEENKTSTGTKRRYNKQTNKQTNNKNLQL